MMQTGLYLDGLLHILVYDADWSLFKWSITHTGLMFKWSMMQTGLNLEGMSHILVCLSGLWSRPVLI